MTIDDIFTTYRNARLIPILATNWLLKAVLLKDPVLKCPLDIKGFCLIASNLTGIKSSGASEKNGLAYMGLILKSERDFRGRKCKKNGCYNSLNCHYFDNPYEKLFTIYVKMMM